MCIYKVISPKCMFKKILILKYKTQISPMDLPII